MIRRINQNGVAILEVILLVAVLGIFGYVAFTAIKARQKPVAATTPITTSAQLKNTGANLDKAISEDQKQNDTDLAKLKEITK